PLLTVQGREALVGAGTPHDDRRVAHGRSVVGVQRLAELPEDVVRHVDDVADRSEPDRAQPRPEPRRRRPDRDAAEHARREPVAEVRRLDADARELPGALARLLQGDRGRTQAGAGQRGELARDAEHREAVRTVRGDLDLEDVVVEPERRYQVRAELGAVDLEEARLVLFAQTELALGAEHALRLDTVDLRGRDPPAGR